MRSALDIPVTVQFACLECGTPSPTKRCAAHGGTNTKPSPWTRGYQIEFLRNRARLLADKPACDTHGCTNPATIAHHQPKRTQLLAMQVTNPDGLEWLRPLCDPCHRTITGQGR